MNQYKKIFKFCDIRSLSKVSITTFLLTMILTESLFSQTCKVTDFIYLNDPQDYQTQGFVHKLKIGTGGNLTEVGNGNGTSPWFPAGGGLGSPHGLGQDLNGNLYIGATDFGPVAKIKCDGTLENLNFINDGGFNIISKDGYLYVNSASNNRISRYSLCDGSLQGYVTLNGISTQPYSFGNGVQVDWGLDIATDGTIYASSGFNGFGAKSIYRFKPTDIDFLSHTDYMPLVTSTDVPPGVAAAGLNMGKAWIWGITHDNSGNMYLTVEEPYDTKPDFVSITWVLKYDSNGNLVGSISERGDTPTGGFEGGRGIVYYPVLDVLYVAGGPDGDCIAMINPANMTYMGAAAGNEPNQVPKTLRIASEACPETASSLIDTTLCNVSIGDKIYLQQLIGSCKAPICGGTWVADAGNVGMTFNECDLSFNVTGKSGCGKFVLTNVGGSCGDFTVELKVGFIDIAASVIGGSQTVCATQDPTAFTVVTPAISSETLTYQWQKSTTSCTDGFTDIAGANNSTYDPPVLTQTTHYRVVATGTGSCTSPVNKCSAISNCVTVTVNPSTNAGTDQTLVCTGATPITTATLAAIPIAGGIWTQASTNPAGAMITTSTSATSGLTGLTVGTYKFIWSGINACSDTVQIVVPDCTPICTKPTVGIPIATQATCVGAMANNDAKIVISSILDGNKYIIGTSNANFSYSSAITFTGSSITISNLVNPLASTTYYIRIYNGAESCYTDTQQVTLLSRNCTTPCGTPNCLSITVKKN